MITLDLPPYLTFDMAHLRHYISALRIDPGVRLVDPASGEVADVTFTLQGQGRLKVCLLHADPHGFIFDCGNSLAPFLDAKMMAVPADYDVHAWAASWAPVVAQMNPNTKIPILDPYDIIIPVMLDPYDMVLAPKLQHAKILRGNFSVPGETFYTTHTEPRFIGVYFLGSICHAYPLRRLMIQWLHANDAWENPRSEIKFYHGQSPAPSEQEKFRTDLAAFDRHQLWYADCLRHSKVMVFDGGVTNYPVQKYFEAMACGCLAMAPLPRDAALLGFVDGVTMVAVDHTDFKDKIRYYTDPAHEAERLKITTAAWELVQRNYTCEAAARILVRKLTAIRDGAAVESVDGSHE